MPLLRHVLKALARQPWYTTSIVVVIAVASTLLTSVLAIVDGVLFKPLGYPGERDLVAVEVFSSGNRSTPEVTEDDLAAWSAAAPGAAFTGFRAEGAEGTNVGVVAPSFFDVIGVRPAIGGLAPADFEGPRPRIQPRILTDAVFTSQFDGDPDAIGRTVITDPSSGYGYRIAGVMPPGFRFPFDTWPVGAITAYAEGRYAPFGALRDVIARLPAGTTAAELEARLHAAAAARNAVRSGTNSRDLPIDRVRVTPLGRALGAESRPLFLALLAAAALLVVLAAVNASSLMASRSVDRRRELAVRRALGASRLDICRLLLVAAGVLVGAGTTVGFLAAAPALRFISLLLPERLVLFRSPAIDARVLAFSVAITAVLAILVTIWPLRLADRVRGAPEHARGVSSQARSWNWRVVVATQVGLALVLTLGGSLLVGSLLAVYANTPPVNTKDTLTIEVDFLGMTTKVAREAPERSARVDALLERVRAVPGD